MFVSSPIPMLLVALVGASALEIWTVLQQATLAEAWHKYSPQPFLRSLRRWDIQERYCLDTTPAYNGHTDWYDALGVLNYSLLSYDVPDAVHWHKTGNYAINMQADNGDVCGSGNIYYPGTINIRIHIMNDASGICGGTAWNSETNRSIPFRCVYRGINTYAYAVCYPNSDCVGATWIGYTYNAYDVYLDQNRICCKPPHYFGDRNYAQGVQHTNHELGHVFGLADPTQGEPCNQYWSVMHQRFYYGCSDTRWPTYDTYYPNDIGSVSVIVYNVDPNGIR